MLEDGRILEKEPPHVVVDTIEDIETHETNHLEDQDVLDELKAVMEKSYGEIERRNNHKNHDSQSQTTIDSKSSTRKGKKTRRSKYDHEKPELISDSFQRTVNTHDVKGKV